MSDVASSDTDTGRADQADFGQALARVWACPRSGMAWHDMRRDGWDGGLFRDAKCSAGRGGAPWASGQTGLGRGLQRGHCLATALPCCEARIDPWVGSSYLTRAWRRVNASTTLTKRRKPMPKAIVVVSFCASESWSRFHGRSKTRPKVTLYGAQRLVLAWADERTT